MRSLLVIVTVAAVLASAAGAVITVRPVLRLVSYTPLTLSGSGWHAGERVRVTLRQDGARAVRYARAGSAGRFALTFSGVRIDRCAQSGLVVTAVGASGERVIATVGKSLPAPQCPPQP